MVANLSQLTVNGKAISTEHRHITLPVKIGQELLINYELSLFKIGAV